MSNVFTGVVKKLATPVAAPKAKKIDALLPEDCILAYSNGYSTYYLIEKPPSIKLFMWGHYSPQDAEVAIPWEYYWISSTKYTPWYGEDQSEGETHAVASLQLFWSKQQIKSLDDIVRVARLPNISGGGASNGLVCLGSSLRKGKTSKEAVDTTVRHFYLSRFNNDYGFPVPYRDVRMWEQKTKEDPQCWKTWRETATYHKPLRNFIHVPKEIDIER